MDLRGRVIWSHHLSSTMAFEDVAIDWSIYAGNGGNGSIQRRYTPGEGFTSTPGPDGDSPANFVVTFETSFGDFPVTGAITNQ